MNLRQDVVRKIVHVGIALDESGSMAGCKRQTLDGLNEQIQELKKHSEIETTITLVTFAGDKDIKVKYSAKPLAEIECIKDEEYNPDGGTAMYDGVARLLNELQNKVEDNDSTTYVVMVVSDGEENQSREYDSAKVAEMIKTRQETKRWTINYLGANQDINRIKRSLGVASGCAFTYQSTGLGTSQMWDTAVNSTRNYYSTRLRSSSAVAPDMVMASVNFIQPVDNTAADTTSN
jgi:uncharacterized protein YegL